jgi:hypothetical protein
VTQKRKRGIKTNNLSDRLNQPGFVKVDVSDKDSILAANTGLENYQSIERATASRDTYQNVETNISVRDTFRRGDYDYFRSSESIPKRPEDIIHICMQAYRRVGLIRNIIDLMSDFGAEGVKLVHPNPRVQKFYRGWFKKVGGSERTERFLNVLYRCGNTIVNRSMAKIDLKDEKRMRTLGIDEVISPDIKTDTTTTPLQRSIPYRYVFLNPLTLEILGKDIAQFVGKQAYAVKINNNLRRAAQSPKNEYERKLIQALPVDLRNAILRGDREFPLDPKKVSAYFYKKDDWQNWADPLVFAVLDDLILLEKMKLADLAALDGAISQVRLWKLGDLEMGIFPTDVAVNKLAEILLSNTGGGAFDLIWGPELNLEETSTDVHSFLGGEKYEPVYNSIYAGLGVPPTLTGASTASGFTNNYISLKTLIQRLEYGRSVVRSFWEQEIELVRQAMNFQRGATVEFDHMTLSDEAAEKALYIQLADRDIISIDTILERFGEIPEIEMLKRRREDRLRKVGQMSEKASPYHAPEKMHERVVAALSRGYLSPEQAEIEIPTEFQGQKSPFDKQLEAQIKAKQMGGTTSPKKKGGGTGGRPKTSKDSSPRKRTPKPLAASNESVDFLSHLVWAKDAQAKISNLVTPAILAHFNKKNLRSLSAEETEQAERIKFRLLCSLRPFTEVNEEQLAPILSAGMLSNGAANLIYKKYLEFLKNKNSRDPTFEELRLIQASAYATLYTMGLDLKSRGVVQGFGSTETAALIDAKRNVRTGFQESVTFLSTTYQKVPEGWICTLVFEYEIKVT